MWYQDPSVGWKKIENDPAAFEWIALDNNYAYAYTTGFLWKFKTSTGKFQKIYTFPSQQDHAFTKIFTSGNRIILYTVEKTFNAYTYFFAVYRDDSGKITYIGSDQVFDKPQNF